MSPAGVRIGLRAGLAAATVLIGSPACAYTLLDTYLFLDYSGEPGSATTSSSGSNTAGSSEVSGGLTFNASSVSDTAGGIVFHQFTSLTGTVTSTSAPSNPLGDTLAASSLAGFSDTVTVTSPGQSGSGFLLVSLGYQGTLTASGGAVVANAFGVACAESDGCSSSLPFSSVEFGNNGGGPPSGVFGNAVIGEIPFTFNTPFPFTVYLVGNAGVGHPQFGQSLNVSDDFSDTGTLLPFKVFDSNGTVDGAAVVRSDTSNLVFPTAVPEPSTWSTMIIGAGLIGAALRAQQRIVRRGAVKVL